MISNAALAGRRAIITGAGKGIGEAIARQFAKQGAQVVLVARSAGDLERVAGEIRTAGGVAHCVPADMEIAIFRIVQECLTNVARHARATQAFVWLARSDAGLLLEVRDNGEGFSEERLADPNSLGVAGMRERALLLGGEAGLRSGEMVALEWSDVDLSKRQLCVQRSAWKGQVEAPKGGRLRYVPLTTRLAAALRESRHLWGPRVLYQDDGEPLTEKRWSSR